jgi:hypothetical protein
MKSFLTSGKRGSRTIVTLLAPAAVLAAAAMLAQPAAAAPPTRIDFASSGSFTLDAGTLCSFPVDVGFAQQGTTTGFFDGDGILTKRITVGTERDTFSANGTTLVGDTYHFTFVSEFENGVRVDYHENGVAERVPLPDGGIFIVAGRVDLLASGGGFILSVDSGNSGNNLEAFCAALS